MLQRTLSCLALLCLGTTMLFAQKAPMKFGKIDEDDLSLASCSFEPEADAMVLGEYTNLYVSYLDKVGWRYTCEYHVRIKVFSREGLDEANHTVFLYRGSDDEESIRKIKGTTYSLIEGKVEKTALEKSSIFKEDVNDRLIKMEFTMPAVQEGSIIEYSYTITSPYYYTLRPWQYQGNIPRRWSEAHYRTPEFLYYQTVFSGEHPLSVTEQGNYNERFRITYYTERTGNVTVTNRNMQVSEIPSNSRTYRWKAENIPSISDEPFMTRVEDYASKIAFQLTTIKYPGQAPEQVLGTYAKFSEQLKEMKGFGSRYLSGSFMPAEVATLLAGAQSETDKAIVLYETLKRHCRWNGAYNVISGKNLREFWKSQEGSSADFNLNLVAMFRRAGLKAYPIVLSTRNHGKMHPTYPNFDAINYVLALVLIDGQSVLCDASRGYLPMGIIPENCLNGRGWLVGDPGNWVNLQIGSQSKEVSMVTIAQQADGNLTAKVKITGEGYPALRMRRTEIVEGEEQQVFENQLKEANPNWQLDSLVWDERENIYAPAKGTAHFTLNAPPTGDRIYLDPILYGLIRENPFKRETRSFPIDMEYPFEQDYTVNIMLAEGYEFEEIPEPGAIKLPDEDAMIQYYTQAMGGLLSLKVKLNLNKTFYPKEAYPLLRQFYEVSAQKASQQIVIRKKS